MQLMVLSATELEGGYDHSFVGSGQVAWLQRTIRIKGISLVRFAFSHRVRRDPEYHLDQARVCKAGICSPNGGLNLQPWHCQHHALTNWAIWRRFQFAFSETTHKQRTQPPFGSWAFPNSAMRFFSQGVCLKMQVSGGGRECAWKTQKLVESMVCL